MGFGNQFAVQKSSTRRVACGPRPAVSNCNKSSTENIGKKRYSGLRQYRFLFGSSFRFGGKGVAATLWTDAAGRNEKLATQGEKGTSRTDELHHERGAPSIVLCSLANKQLPGAAVSLIRIYMMEQCG
jgi:hypothetical protein